MVSFEFEVMIINIQIKFFVGLYQYQCFFFCLRILFFDISQVFGCIGDYFLGFSLELCQDCFNFSRICICNNMGFIIIFEVCQCFCLCQEMFEFFKRLLLNFFLYEWFIFFSQLFDRFGFLCKIWQEFGIELYKIQIQERFDFSYVFWRFCILNCCYFFFIGCNFIFVQIMFEEG